jgi:nitric oxide synthase oxygenase domain/subunit
MRHPAFPFFSFYMCDKLASRGMVIDHRYTALSKRV